MNIVLLGIQGSGKGTVVFNLQQHLDFALISTGQLLRDEVASGSDLGKHIDCVLVSGQLVDNGLVADVIKSKLKTVEDDIIIFDGFPRNIEQANILNSITNVDLVIHLDLSKDKAIERLNNRLICENCGHITSASVATNAYCIKCGNPLTKRTDDNVEAIEKRLETYERETKPLLEMFRQSGVVVDVDADRFPTEIVNDILKVIENERNN